MIDEYHLFDVRHIGSAISFTFANSVTLVQFVSRPTPRAPLALF
jgi:hypothetical protein